jgi:hypothetical protein
MAMCRELTCNKLLRTLKLMQYFKKKELRKKLYNYLLKKLL